MSGARRSTIASKPAPVSQPERSGSPVEAIVVSVDAIVPNPWNPNVMDEAMFQKELASIRKYGFVDPLTVRELPDIFVAEVATAVPPFKQELPVQSGRYQIIDGEHRWKGAKQLGYTELPCWNLGFMEDDDAQELTVVLNETRGKSNEDRLRAVLQGLIARRGEEAVREIMPFNRGRFDELVGRMRVDWDQLEKRREAGQAEGRWKELVYRMPHDAAKVVEDAVAQVRDREGFDDSWRALEMICADSLA